MEWKAEFLTGIAEIDDHHRTILDFVTEFEKAAAAKMHWNTVQPLLVRAREFARFHFSVEESLMQILKYPEYADHRAQHQDVLAKLAMLETGVLRQRLKEEALPLFRTWLIDHIVWSDKNFSQWALAQYPGLKPGVARPG